MQAGSHSVGLDAHLSFLQDQDIRSKPLTPSTSKVHAEIDRLLVASRSEPCHDPAGSAARDPDLAHQGLSRMWSASVATEILSENMPCNVKPLRLVTASTTCNSRRYVLFVPYTFLDVTSAGSTSQVSFETCVKCRCPPPGPKSECASGLLLLVTRRILSGPACVKRYHTYQINRTGRQLHWN